MAGSKTKKRFTGVRRDQRVRIDARRDDTRTFRQRLSAATGKTSGTAWLFGGLAAASLMLSWAPFVPEVLFLLALGLFLSNYSFARKRWSLPIRVPAYLNKVMGEKVHDATTGKPGAGNIYLGRDEESGEEIWVQTGDLNKHSRDCAEFCALAHFVTPLGSVLRT
jgi:intracellular multiplication protein IcmO